MKYLVTWHFVADQTKICQCRYFYDKSDAMKLYRELSSIKLNFEDVRLIKIAERPAKKLTVKVVSL